MMKLVITIFFLAASLVSFGYKKLPAPGKSIYWPDGVAQKEIDKAYKYPDFKKKLEVIEKLRHSSPPNKFYLKRNCTLETVKGYISNIKPDGSFKDISPEIVMKWHKKRRTSTANPPRYGEAYCGELYKRHNEILYFLINDKLKLSESEEKLWVKSLIYSFEYEYFRTDYRWVVSSFNMPKLATRVYLHNLKKMDDVESGKIKDLDWRRLNQLCKAVAGECVVEDRKTRPGAALTIDSFRRHGHWVSGNFGYRPFLDTALVCRNPLILDVFMDVMKKTLSYTNYNLAVSDKSFWNQGMTADGLGWGHGRQNYITRYPSDHLRICLKSLVRLRNSTYWTIDPELLNYIAKYVDSALWYGFNIHKYGFTLMVPDRVAMRYNPNHTHLSYGGIQTIAMNAKNLVPPQKTKLKRQLKDAIEVMRGKAKEPSGARYFWNNDDLIFRQKDFFFGFAMVSRRSVSNEVVVSQSSHTDYLGDGATYIMKRGDTYAEAKGFWKPFTVPGVTARNIEYPHKQDTWKGYEGKHNFSGGVTNDGNGVAGFIYEKAPRSHVPTPQIYNVKANKSCFCFKSGEVLCLGSGISNLTPQLAGKIKTTVDNTEWTGKLEYDNKSANPKASVKTKAKTVFHEGIGYAALGKTPFLLEAEVRPEQWLLFDRNNNLKRSNRPKTLPMLKMSFDHGIKPKNSSYEYLIHFKAESMNSMKSYLKKCPLVVLSNTPELQAVRHEKLKITQAVFFDPKAVLNDGKRCWRVDSPAVIMIRENENGDIVFTVNDPEQLKSKTKLILTTDIPINGLTLVEIKLPQDIFCGKPVSRTIKNTSHP